MDENEALYSRNETLQMDNLIKRYQKCADRIWALFPTDPLPDDDHAHFMIERLESILNHGLLVPKPQIERRINQRGAAAEVYDDVKYLADHLEKP